MGRPLSKVLWLLVLVAIVPATAYAQGSIAGTVKDTSGAVLPGVTVEASSPALIEKTRSVVTDGGGKVRSALDVIEGSERAARFLVEVTRPRPGAWWRHDFTVRFAPINGLPGVIVEAPEGAMQTTAFEIEGESIRAMYVVRNPDKLRHLAKAGA